MPHARPLRLALGTLVALALLSLPPLAGAGGKPSTAALQVGLQKRGLYAGTISGRMNGATRAGVRRLERLAGVAPRPIGPRARRLLGGYGRHTIGERPLRRGVRGWDAAALQFMLANHGFPSGTLDGIFGGRTDIALRRFQGWAGIGVDGIAGPGTIRALQTPAPRSPLSFRAPVAGFLSDRFGPRGNRFHTGIDYPVPHGRRVRAARAGVVRSAGWDSGGYGNLVVVGHGGGVTTWYAHLSAVRVHRGQRVAAGTIVGRVGSTGNASGPHLHFEVRVRGAAVDPLPALR